MCLFSDANESFNMDSGILIAVPTPSTVGDDIEQVIREALCDAK